MEHTTAHQIAEVMKKGGGFMEALADAYLKADALNGRRILDMWSNEIEDLFARFGPSRTYSADVTVTVQAKNPEEAYDLIAEQVFAVDLGSKVIVEHVDEPEEV